MEPDKREQKDRSPCEICLINPPWFTKDRHIWHKIGAIFPPLGLLSIASYLEGKGQSVALIDVNAQRLTIAELKERIYRLQPRIIGLTVLTATAIQSHLIARLAKQVDPSIVVIAGGVHAEILPEECLSNNAIDIVVRGDGEITFYLLCEAILGKQPYTHIAGISFRDIKDNKTSIVCHQPAELIRDLNQLPSPAYHLAPIRNYAPAVGAYRNLPALNMLMTRGCLGKCSFCNSAHMPLRSRDPALVVEEILKLNRLFGIKEIQFYDDAFTANREKALRFCGLMKERRAGVAWTAFTRADCMDEGMARQMKQAGCHQIMLGIESADAGVLNRMGKPIQLKQTAEATKIIRKEGIEIRCAFVYGAEGETAASMRETLGFALKLNPDLAVFNIATPFPGTQLYKWAKLNGYLLHEDWSRYGLEEPVMELPTVSAKEVMDFCRKSFEIFYGRPGAIWNRLKRVRSLRHLSDALSVFGFIELGLRSGGKRFVTAEEWETNKKSDFFDYPFHKTSAAPLSWENYR
jgi:anaerobic magnesium-protoporphyrin IX monomethyl ester cyclase